MVLDGRPRSISDPEKLAACAKLARPTVEAPGGHFLARGGTIKVFGAAVTEPVVWPLSFRSVRPQPRLNPAVICICPNIFQLQKLGRSMRAGKISSHPTRRAR
jgi:hypothetical protein